MWALQRLLASQQEGKGTQRAVSDASFCDQAQQVYCWAALCPPGA